MFPEEFRTPSFRSAFLSVSQRDLKTCLQMVICAGHILKVSERSHDGLGLRPKPCSWYLKRHSLAQQACPVLCVPFIPNCLPFPLASWSVDSIPSLLCVVVCSSLVFTHLYMMRCTFIRSNNTCMLSHVQLFSTPWNSYPLRYSCLENFMNRGPARPLCSWNFLSKSTGVGSCFLLHGYYIWCWARISVHDFDWSYLLECVLFHSISSC